jgi:hypothetical protein
MKVGYAYHSNFMRGSLVKARLFQRGRIPWRGENPREPRTSVSLNRLAEVADFHVEKSLEAERVS